VTRTLRRSTDGCVPLIPPLALLHPSLVSSPPLPLPLSPLSLRLWLAGHCGARQRGRHHPAAAARVHAGGREDCSVAARGEALAVRGVRVPAFFVPSACLPVCLCACDEDPMRYNNFGAVAAPRCQHASVGAAALSPQRRFPLWFYMSGPLTLRLTVRAVTLFALVHLLEHLTTLPLPLDVPCAG